MKKRNLYIASGLIIISIILGICICQGKFQAAWGNHIITDITDLCSSKKVIIDGNELNLKINREIRIPPEDLKSKYSIVQTSNNRVLALDASVVDNNKEIMSNKDNPMIAEYSIQKGQAQIDEKELTWEIYKQILLADFTKKYKEKTNEASVRYMTILTHEEGDTVKAISISSHDKGFRIKYNIVGIENGILEVRSEE